MNTGLLTLLLATTLLAPASSLGSSHASEPRSPSPPVNRTWESRARQVEQYFELALTSTHQGNLEEAITSYQKVLKL
ncbi:MAG: tetratricopeptide repeat protein, partial [Microcystaceae cyanobacterium]